MKNNLTVTTGDSNDLNFQQFDRAWQALTLAVEAGDTQSMMQVRDQAAAAALYAKRQQFHDVAQQAQILALEAEYRLGEWLRDNVDHRGGNPQFYDYQGLPEGITRKQSSDFQLLAQLPRKKFSSYIEECTASGSDVNAGALRRIARAWVGKGQDLSSPASFDFMLERIRYWLRCIEAAYPDRLDDARHVILDITSSPR